MALSCAQNRSILWIMDQNTQIPEVLNGSRHLRIPLWVWSWATIGGLVLGVYWHVLIRLVTAWLQLPDYSHGILVPIFACYLIWVRKEKLLKAKAEPTWAGVLVVFMALALLLLGELGAELFLSRVSLIVLCAGLTLGFAGWPTLKELRFALLVLFLAVPIPAIIFNQIALPLEGLASKLASVLLHTMGVPALRLGNLIVLPDMRLEVAEACSGIRSLVSLFTLAVFYGYFFEKTFTRRTILAFASIPIAITANAIRIFGTGMCVQYWDADKALGFFHQFSGWVMFMVSLGCLSAVHYLMLLVPIRGRRAI
jgi:exosortase